MTPTPDPAAGVRRRNLAAVLGLVHRGDALTRADLTARTGLNRSTVGDLVGELVRLGLLVESPGEPQRRVGRPSPAVRVAEQPVVVAINPETDAITAGLVGLGGRVQRRVRRVVDAPPDPAEALAIAVELVAGLVAAAPRDRRVIGIGLAIPGLVRASDGLVRLAPHLGWRDEPFAAAIAEATGLPASAANDASLGALAERRFGAGRGVDELVHLNGGGSGIGGGVIARGELLTGAHGYAGEFGHGRPGVPDADLVTAERTLEAEVGRARLLGALGLADADEPELRRAVLASADPAVRAELARQQRVLAAAIADAVNVFAPELVVLGGALSVVREWDADALDALVTARALPIAREGAAIRSAALGRDRLLIGAAELALARVLEDPGSVAG